MLLQRMSAYDLLQRPLWGPEVLGWPIPPGPHAVSVALPRWEDVVGYEEKRAEVMDRLQAGYPRFVIQQPVLELARFLAGGNRPCLPFPSPASAEDAAAFVRAQTGEPVEVRTHAGVTGVVTTEAGLPVLKAFWQHTGRIVSTRQAQSILAGRAEGQDGQEARQELRRALAELYDCNEADVFLTPSGMAAQWASLRAVQALRPGLPTVQLGFPYVDTLKLQQKWGCGVTLLHDLDRATEELQRRLEQGPLAAVFCEVPGNPLLGAADLRRVSPLLRACGVPLVADDVVATPFNVDLGRHADLIATSLTKFVAGTGDVMGGAVICCPRSPLHAILRRQLERLSPELLWGEDALVILRGCRTFADRMQRHNASGLFIAEQLRRHPAVERVWYPKWESAEAYEAVRRPGGGWGALVTFLPRDAARAAPLIYDGLEVCKGPSLGTVFTLACPFTMLAHYVELDWAEACGVSRYLIRISVGLEDPPELWNRLARALQRALGEPLPTAGGVQIGGAGCQNSVEMGGDPSVKGWEPGQSALRNSRT